MNKVRQMSVIVGLLLLAGCSSNNEGKIEGTKWSSIATTMKGSTLPAGALKLEFTRDGSVIYSIKPRIGKTVEYRGTYQLNSGDYVTLSLDKELAGHKKHRQKIVIDGDTLSMSDTDGTTVRFSRVN